MTALRLVASLLLTALLAGSAGADCPAPGHARPASYALPAVVVQPVLAATFVPVPLVVPSYSVGYAAPAAAADAAELQRLRQEIEALKRARAPAPQPQTLKSVSAGALALFRSKCAACHERAIAKAKGGGFVLLEGNQLARLSDRQARKVGTRVYAGTMPPRQRASDEEVAAVMAWLDALE